MEILMKSKICIAILFVMLFVVSSTMNNFQSIAVSTSGANIVVDTKNVVQGNEVIVNINLQDDVDFVAGNFTLSYDRTKLEYKSYEVGSALKNSDGTTNGSLIMNDQTSGQIKIGYMSDASQTSETKNAGELLSLTFYVSSGAGTTTDLELACTTLKKTDGTNVNANITNGELRIISGIQMNTSDLNIKVGKSSTLSVSTLPTSVDISTETITWKSENEAIATVNSNGVVTAVAPGSTKITATVLSKTATCTVFVPGELISISLDKTSLTLPKQQIKKLIVSYNPEDTLEDKTVTWSSSNETVATIDQNGLVTAIQDGTTTITATVGDKTATCIITVSGKLGDVDKDDNITAYDAYKALEASADILIGAEVDEQTILTSDVDKDQDVTANDAHNILKYSVGLINEF